MKNIEDLRDKLKEVFEDLKTGKMEPYKAKEINNTAGRIMDTVKIQLANAVMRKEKPEIKFLKVESSPIITAIENLKKEDENS